MNESLEQSMLAVAKGMDWEQHLDFGAGSCVNSWQCLGVSLSDLEEFARRMRAAWDAEQELSASIYQCPHCNAEQKQEPVACMSPVLRLPDIGAPFEGGRLAGYDPCKCDMDEP